MSVSRSCLDDDVNGVSQDVPMPEEQDNRNEDQHHSTSTVGLQRIRRLGGVRLNAGSYGAEEEPASGLSGTSTHPDEKTERPPADSEKPATWEAEKRMIHALLDKREKELQEQIADLMDDKKLLTRRIHAMEKHQKHDKMKLELHRAAPRSMSDSVADSQDELESCKQQIYMLQTDLHKMDSELSSQQKVFVGIICGLRQDFWDALGKFINERSTGSLGPTTLNKLRLLGERLGTIFESAAQGHLAQLKAQLPDNYQAKDRDVFRPPVRKLSVPYIARSALISARRSSAGRTDSPWRRPFSALDLANGNGSSCRDEIPSTFHSPPSSSSSSNSPGNNTWRCSDIKHNKDLSPPLVDPTTGTINCTKVLGFFPHIAQNVVMQHWKNFSKYDNNHDFCLDLHEMINASNAVFGDKYTVSQIQELLFEVDRDGSNTIDFFEYLTIASMISRKEGRSAIFKKQLDSEQRRTVAKMCVVM